MRVAVAPTGDTASPSAATDDPVLTAIAKGLGLSPSDLHDRDPAALGERLAGLILLLTGELRELLSASKDAEVQASALEALGIAGASDDLAAVAAGSGALPLRLQALRGLGIAGAGERLVELYPRLQSVELKAAAREGLLISGHQSGLRQLYSAAQDPNEKRELLKLISLLGGDEALDAIEQAIEQGEGR